MMPFDAFFTLRQWPFYIVMLDFNIEICIYSRIL